MPPPLRKPQSSGPARIPTKQTTLAESLHVVGPAVHHRAPAAQVLHEVLLAVEDTVASEILVLPSELLLDLVVGAVLAEP